MVVIEKCGKTEQEAIESALKELGATMDEVEIEVLEESSKGLFGIIGSKQARVKVIKKDNYGKEAREFISTVFDKMGIHAQIEVKEEDDSIKIDLKGENMGLLIGHRGETLDSLQYLTSLVVNKGKENYKKVMLDTENYRQKREKTLEKLAKRLAHKVRKTGKRVVLEPMNPYERRILHSTLQDHPHVKTYSEGEEPFRKVIISLK
ncbi:MAG: RNA-binding cell elongation regulator Jag/EloR [Mahellales bacterium]|jgi:spoIIIJ-associated protein